MGMALLFGAGLIFGTGASAQVVNDEFLITDDDNPLTFAVMVADGIEYGVIVTGTCLNGDDSVVFYVDSLHPDKVKVKEGFAEVIQKRDGNPNLLGIVGAGGRNFEAGIVGDCKSTLVKASVKTKKVPNTGKFKVVFKKCESTLEPDEVVFIEDTCDGQDEIKGKIDEDTGEIKKLKIKGKGNAVAED
jgi:hypothetical protein